MRNLGKKAFTRWLLCYDRYIFSNPTPEEGIDPLFGIKWPKVSPQGDVPYLNFESELTTAVNPEAEAMNFWDELYAKYGNPPYNTY